MTRKYQWLDSPDEDDDELASAEILNDGSDHHPIQSRLYTDNKPLLMRIQKVLTNATIIAFVLMISISSWINLEEGEFPFNIDFVADAAYDKKKMGTPLMVLSVALFVGVVLLFVRLMMIAVTENTVYNSLKEYLSTRGRLRLIKPLKPEQN